MQPEYNYIFKRRHRLYQKNVDIWRRSKDAYTGGFDYIQQALVRHVSEIELEFAERLRRAYYFNYPRKIARLITQFILSVEPQRDHADLAMVEDFSRGGLRANEVMRQFSTLLNVYGSAALVVEMPFFDGEMDCERKQLERIRPAVRALSPLEVVDWAYGSDGKLDWMIVEEIDQLNAGPFLPPVDVKRRKLFTRDECLIFERDSVSGIAVLLSRAPHNLGCVPAVFLIEPDGFGIDGGHYFEDVVRISDAILNNESEAQMNIVKQMFGLLVISEAFARSGSRDSGNERNPNEKFSHVLARSAAIWESAEEKNTSRYISPSGADTAAIRGENEALKRELFDAVGMSLVTPSRDAQTAEAKAWDYHQIRQFLACRVDLLEQAEQQCWAIVHAYDRTIAVPSVVYNREFSIGDLSASIAALLNLKQFSDGPAFQREIGKTALFLLEKIKKLDPESRREIQNELTEA